MYHGGCSVVFNPRTGGAGIVRSGNNRREIAMTIALDNQSEMVDLSTRVRQRISVRAPYFDLRDLDVADDGAVRALVPVTPPVHPETGLIEAAQAARHLAILGSCAVALQRDDDDRHHYLATRAHFLRTANITEADRVDTTDVMSVDFLVAEASGTWIDRRSARALVKLYGPDGELSHALDVHYTVMTPRMFSRLMPPIDVEALRDDSAGGAVSAGLSNGGVARFDVRDLEVDEGSGVTVDCGPIPIDMCAGHFPDYPAAPVALVMGQLARAAGVALNRHLGFGALTHSIDEARVTATKLGRAGQRLTLRARYDRRVGGGHLLVGTAQADGETIGEMELTLSTTSLPESIPFPVGALA